MGAALRFKQINVPRQQGEQARLKVVQGPDYGTVYVITGTRSSLGRGEENDIMVSDLKASRRHAEFLFTPSGWVVRDTGSANGLLHNGKATRDARIQSGDTLTFGETTLEFVASEVGTMMLVAPPRAAAELHAERAAFEDQKKRARSFGVIQGGGGGAEPANNRKTLLYVAVAGAVAFLVLGDSGDAPKGNRKRTDTKVEDLGKYLPGMRPDPTTERAAEQFFKAGFREFINGNYLRAKTQFEIVLQMAPGHPLANIYLQNCEMGIQELVQFHITQGKISMEAGRLKDSKAHYESVHRILHRDQANPKYVEAKDQLERVLRMISGVEEVPLAAPKRSEPPEKGGG